MGRVPFSFTDVNKDIWERERVWGEKHAESGKKERDTEKSQSEADSEKRKRDRSKYTRNKKFA